MNVIKMNVKKMERDEVEHERDEDERERVEDQRVEDERERDEDEHEREDERDEREDDTYWNVYKFINFVQSLHLLIEIRNRTLP